jgi:hypothetical protein
MPIINDICNLENYDLPRDHFISYEQMEKFIKLGHSKQEAEFILSEGMCWIWHKSTKIKEAYAYFPLAAQHAIKLKFS